MFSGHSPSFPFVSVIIPVYNDTDRLMQCLECLAAQSYPRDRLEVIVVDNGSRESPRKRVEEFPFCKFAEESTPGSYAARNRGLELARGTIIAFTDADCLPDLDWLAVAQRELAANPTCGFIGGGVEIFPADPARPSAVELYDMIFGLNQCSCVTRHQYAVTANLVARRSTIDHVGPFDVKLKSLGDADWGQRASSKGFPGLYVEDALIRHPARRHFESILTQARRLAGGRFDRHRCEPYRYKSLHFWRILWRSIIPKFEKMNRARRQLQAQGYGATVWLKTIPVILAVQYASLWEFLRKRLGRPSERR